jgi:hypothetical protein
MTPCFRVIGSRRFQKRYWSGNDCPLTPRHIAEVRKPQLHHNESLKTCFSMGHQSQKLLHKKHHSKNSAFSPHSAFMCFEWFSQNTTITSLHRINRLAFVMQAHFEFCDVGMGFLKVFPWTSDVLVESRSWLKALRFSFTLRYTGTKFLVTLHKVAPSSPCSLLPWRWI